MNTKDDNTNKYDIVAVGDVNIDFVVHHNLPFSFHSLVDNGVIHWDEIDEIPGGSGLNFCSFASDAGYRSFIVSKVGDDFAGRIITKWLMYKKISFPGKWYTTAPTGKALILRDMADIRLLVNNKRNANHCLDVKDIEENKDAISSCKVLYISGYAINEPESPRYQSVLYAMEYAKSVLLPPVIVFDVVPHRIYEKFSFEQFIKHIKNVDIVISEVATIRRFLGLGLKTESIDEKIAQETAQQFSIYYDRFILRYGPSGCDRQILFDKLQNEFHDDETGHNFASDKRGFGDKLALIALRDFFRVLPS